MGFNSGFKGLNICTASNTKYEERAFTTVIVIRGQYYFVNSVNTKLDFRCLECGLVTSGSFVTVLTFTQKKEVKTVLTQDTETRAVHCVNVEAVH